MKAGFVVYEEHKKEFWAFVLIGIPLILLVGSILWRDLFWDAFIWRYLWGPVVADARGTSIGEVSAGYNPVNTLVYGIVLMLALIGIYDLIEYFDIEVDTGFVLSLIPWVVLGGSLRTLEDAGLFSESVAPLFISPVIYLLLGVGAILTMMLGTVISGREESDILRLVVLVPPLIVYVLLRLPYSLRLGVLGIIVLSIFYVYGRKKQILHEKYLFLTYGTTFLTISLSYNAYFLWTLEGTNPIELVLIPLFTVIATISFVLVLFTYDRLHRSTSALGIFFFSKLNALIVFAHLFDASSTYRGIKYHGYAEKHVVPSFFIEFVGDPIVMYFLKLVLIVVVILTMDHLYRRELREFPRLTTLLKFAIITLGLAPGVRNTLRLAMGV